MGFVRPLLLLKSPLFYRLISNASSARLSLVVHRNRYRNAHVCVLSSRRPPVSFLIVRALRVTPLRYIVIVTVCSTLTVTVLCCTVRTAIEQSVAVAVAVMCAVRVRNG